MMAATAAEFDPKVPAAALPIIQDTLRILEKFRAKSPQGAAAQPSTTASPYRALLPEEAQLRVAETMAGWAEPVVGPTADGVRIWRRSVAGSAWDEVRGSGIIESKPENVVALFETSDVNIIRSFNPCYDSGHDIEHYSPSAKAAYARLKSVFPGLKPRDSVTAVERHELSDELGGGTVFLLKAIEHRRAPLVNGCVRAKLLGMNLIQPVPGEPDKCEFTFTQVVDPGGAVPARIMNMLVSHQAVEIFTRIRKAARQIGH